MLVEVLEGSPLLVGVDGVDVLVVDPQAGADGNGEEDAGMLRRCGQVPIPDAIQLSSELPHSRGAGQAGECHLEVRMGLCGDCLGEELVEFRVFLEVSEHTPPLPTRTAADEGQEVRLDVLQEGGVVNDVGELVGDRKVDVERVGREVDLVGYRLEGNLTNRALRRGHGTAAGQVLEDEREKSIPELTTAGQDEVEDALWRLSRVLCVGVGRAVVLIYRHSNHLEHFVCVFRDTPVGRAATIISCVSGVGMVDWRG